ncbi:MAG TPA: hypothetical protein VHB18_05215 [Mycobacteriales bacterium]|nr:hypothetical protein [Mycobacteriales bacterium]
MSIDEASLGPLTFLAKGSFGEVYRVIDQHPDVPGALAYKKFTCEVAQQARSAKRVVDFRASLSASERDSLDGFAAWPLALVTDSAGDVCGLIMCLLEPEYFCERIDPDTRKLSSQPREMSWLITTAEQRKAAKIDLPGIDLTDRLILLAKLVYAIGWLHKRGWVLGDLSFKNVAFSLDPLEVKLLDCDGVAEVRNLARNQSSTPFWDPPECPIAGPSKGLHLQDQVTDVYKLGLAILRCLTPGKGASNARSVGRMTDELDATGRDLLARALDADRANRPTAKELYDLLRAAVAQRVSVPVVTVAHLAQKVVLRGMDTRLVWSIKGAAKARILLTNGVTIDVDPDANPAGYTFCPGASGPVTVEAENKYGSVTVECGDVTLYELPAFDLPAGLIPRVSIDPITPLKLPAAMAAVDLRPRLGVGAPTLPVGLVPPSYDAISVLRPYRALDISLPSLSQTLGTALEGIAEAIRAETEQFTNPMTSSQARTVSAARSGP